MSKRFAAVTVMSVALVAAACGSSTTAPAPVTEVASVVPVGGATGVDPTAPATVTFSGPMATGMEMYAALHEGDVTGAEVSGTWSWSSDRTALTFTPSSPLKSQTTYTLHLGGGMSDADGDAIGYERCVQTMGGQWATEQMMEGGMMGGGGMMGPGWRNANGSYGMVFTFTTA